MTTRPQFSIEMKLEGGVALQRKISPPKFMYDEVGRALLESGLEVQRKAQKAVPRRTSRLRLSIVPELSSERPMPLSVRVGTNVKYAPYVEFGTGIYGPEKRPIRPKSRKALAWASKGGDVVLAKGANAGKRGFIRRSIKGMKPRPYLFPALEAARSRINTIWQEAGRRMEQRWRTR